MEPRLPLATRREEKLVPDADDRVPGVAIDLKAWKVALHASDVLLGLLHQHPAVVRVGPSLQGERVVIEVLVTDLAGSITYCLPRSVNGVPVEARAVNLSRKGA
jgi:hypothetical protein